MPRWLITFINYKMSMLQIKFVLRPVARYRVSKSRYPKLIKSRLIKTVNCRHIAANPIIGEHVSF